MTVTSAKSLREIADPKEQGSAPASLMKSTSICRKLPFQPIFTGNCWKSSRPILWEAKSDFRPPGHVACRINTKLRHYRGFCGVALPMHCIYN